MSDIFISQILVLILLFIPLVRPLSDFLKKTQAISVLPLFALLLLIGIIIGQGIYYSLLPLILFTLVVLISELSRINRFVTGLENHIYTITSIIIRMVLILAGCYIAFSVGKFAPEKTYHVDKNIEPISISVDGNNIGQYYDVELNTNDVLIIILPTFKHDSLHTNTIKRVLINDNYDVLHISTLEGVKSSFVIPSGYRFLKITEKILNVNILKNKEEENIGLVLSKLIEQYNQYNSIFIFSDGIYNQKIIDYTKNNPTNVAGVFVFAENNAIQNIDLAWICVIDNKTHDRYTNDITNKPICIFTANKSQLAGFGEVRGDDPLATFLLGSTIDIGRKDRIAVATEFINWIKIKGNYEIK